jgi:unsaturated rhamnogalacturonyl hydrolase
MKWNRRSFLAMLSASRLLPSDWCRHVPARVGAALLPGALLRSGLPAAVRDEFLSVGLRTAEHFIAVRQPTLHYADLLSLYGLIRLAEAAERKDLDSFVQEKLPPAIAQGPTSPSTFALYSMGGLPAAYLFVRKRFPGDPTLLRRHVDLLVKQHPRDAKGVFCHPKEPGDKIWVDCLMAVCPFLSMAAVVLDEPALHGEAIAQYVEMERALLDARLGLFHQSRNLGKPGVSVDTWGRGNGWAVIALVEILRWLPERHPRRAEMIARLEKLMDAVVRRQRPSGMWGQNLATPESYEETSGSGLILYGLAMGLRRGWLPGRMAEAARRGWSGLAAKVDARGGVHDTCIGSRGGAADPVDYWLTRPTKVDDVHAFGPVLLAAVEMHLWHSGGAPAK